MKLEPRQNPGEFLTSILGEIFGPAASSIVSEATAGLAGTPAAATPTTTSTPVVSTTAAATTSSSPLPLATTTSSESSTALATSTPSSSPSIASSAATSTSTSLSSPSAASLAAASTSAVATSGSSGGLSEAAKIGIGVGVGVGGLLLLFLLALLIARRRRRRYDGASDRPSTPWSMRDGGAGGMAERTDRKPLVGAHDPLLSRSAAVEGTPSPPPAAEYVEHSAPLVAPALAAASMARPATDRRSSDGHSDTAYTALPHRPMAWHEQSHGSRDFPTIGSAGAQPAPQPVVAPIRPRSLDGTTAPVETLRRSSASAYRGPPPVAKTRAAAFQQARRLSNSTPVRSPSDDGHATSDRPPLGERQSSTTSSQRRRMSDAERAAWTARMDGPSSSADVYSSYDRVTSSQGHGSSDHGHGRF